MASKRENDGRFNSDLLSFLLTSFHHFRSFVFCTRELSRAHKSGWETARKKEFIYFCKKARVNEILDIHSGHARIALKRILCWWETAQIKSRLVHNYVQAKPARLRLVA